MFDLETKELWQLKNFNRISSSGMAKNNFTNGAFLLDYMVELGFGL